MSKIKLYRGTDSKRIVPANIKTNEDYRSEWRKDQARLLHSAAFRRLQGKTQLFPSHESDFLRNRLTHSLEVSQIAKSIAEKINHEHLQNKDPIRTDIVEIAGWAHDLGHPPFGHNGEEALDECMRDIYGGFEGNAQTLRILTKLEKRQALSMDKNGSPILVKEGKIDNRSGLNLTARTLGSVLKYDKMIPQKGKKRTKAMKGYYKSEKEIVEFIKENVTGNKAFPKNKEFKTIECQVMDIADDIAYSTYDLEDAFKAGFMDPLGMMIAPHHIYEKVANEVTDNIKEQYPNASKSDKEFSANDAKTVLIVLFKELFPINGDSIETTSYAAKISQEIISNGYTRTNLTSELVGRFVNNIEFEYDEECPALSKVKLRINLFKQIETLKLFTYNYLILSPRLKLSEYRGKSIVRSIFEALAKEKNGYMLLPDDYKNLYLLFDKCESQQKRVICDFIAGMTDRYALDFYNRLFGTSPDTMYKPL